MALPKDTPAVKKVSLPKAPGKSIISYDNLKMKVGASEKKSPMPKEGCVKGSK